MDTTHIVNGIDMFNIYGGILAIVLLLMLILEQLEKLNKKSDKKRHFPKIKHL